MVLFLSLRELILTIPDSCANGLVFSSLMLMADLLIENAINTLRDKIRHRNRNLRSPVKTRNDQLCLKTRSCFFVFHRRRFPFFFLMDGQEKIAFMGTITKKKERS